MPSFTRTNLRQMLALDTAGEMFVIGTVAASPAPTTTTCSIAALADSGADTGKYKDRWIYNVTEATADDKERRITVYAVDGAVTLQRALSGAWVAADVVEVHRWAPSLLHEAINNALLRCKYEDELSVTPVADQTEYDLTALLSGAITNKDQVFSIFYTHTPDSNYDTWKEASWARVFDDAGTLYLRIAPPFSNISDYTIKLHVKRPFSKLSTDASTATIDELWIRAGMKVALYELLMERLSPGRERERMAQNLAHARTKYRRYSRLNQPQESRKVYGKTNTWGIW